MSHIKLATALPLTVIALLCHVAVKSFVVPPRTHLTTNPSRALCIAQVKVSQPTSDAAAEAGIREWPQQTKKGQWQESVENGETMLRYILDGSGRVDIQEEDGNTQTFRVQPGTLVEISDQAMVTWESSSPEMIVLTPNFEEGGVFVAVVLVALVLFGSLIAFS